LICVLFTLEIFQQSSGIVYLVSVKCVKSEERKMSSRAREPGRGENLTVLAALGGMGSRRGDGVAWQARAAVPGLA